jgi:ribosomal protein S18 acetylase RimI-like enzyme
MDLSRLWSSSQPGGRIEAAVLVIPHPGRTGLVMTTAPRDPTQAQAVGAVLRVALADMASEGAIRLVQALTSPHEDLRGVALRAGGFTHLASLDYLERPAGARGTAESATLPSGTWIGNWDPRDRAGMVALLRRTYEGTLDCPGLAELRADEDILDGHLHAGEFDPALWFVLHQGPRPIGVLLLSPSAATDSIEVIYLGLAPEARGRGLAAALLAHGARAIAARPERTLALAVDARNTPASKLYERAGFAAVRRREAWIAVPVPAAIAGTTAPAVK